MTINEQTKESKMGKTYEVLKPLVNAEVGTKLKHLSSTPYQTAGLYTEDHKIIVLWCHIDTAIEQGFIIGAVMTEDSNELSKAIKKAFTDNDMTEDGCSDYEDIELFDTKQVVDDIIAYVQSNYILKSESDNSVDEAEKFNYDFGYKCGVNEITMSGDYILKSDVEWIIIGEDEPQTENGLLPDRVDRRNQLRAEQRNRLKESSK